MVIFFSCLVAVGMNCFGLFTYDLIQGNLNRSTKWKDLTGKQWFFFLGTFCLPVGLIGLLAIVG